MAKTVHARTLPVQSLDYKYGKIIVPPYEVDVEFTPLELAALESGIDAQTVRKLVTSDDVKNIVALTLANYDQITPDSATLYLIILP